MLKHPNSLLDFIVTPAYFLGGFNVFDREELEDRLNVVNINNKGRFASLLRNEIFDSFKMHSLRSEHKKILIEVLANALNDKSYDFSVLLSDSEQDSFYLPSEWNIEDPRAFFEQIYKVALEEWKDSL